MNQVLKFTLALSLVLNLSCMKEGTSSEVNYAVNESANKVSLLRDVDSKNLISVCIQERIPTFVKAQGITDADIAKRLNEVQASTDSALKTWLSFLQFNQFWRRNNVNIVYYMGANQCKNKPSDAITIETDVGVSANLRCAGFYLPEPDGRLCRAHAYPLQRQIKLASSGWHGGERVVAHELGHIFGLGDVYDEDGRQTGVETMNENSIMGRSSFFTADDMLGINGVWSYVKFGVTCRNVTEMNTDFKSIYGIMHCTVKENLPVTIASDGKANCPVGYKLSSGQYCIADFASLPVSAPMCPANAPSYDANMGVCCPQGQVYFPGTMSCIDQNMLQSYFSRGQVTNTTSSTPSISPSPPSR